MLLLFHSFVETLLVCESKCFVLTYTYPDWMHMSTSTSLLRRFVQRLFASIKSWTHSQRPRTIEPLLRPPYKLGAWTLSMLHIVWTWWHRELVTPTMIGTWVMHRGCHQQWLKGRNETDPHHLAPIRKREPRVVESQCKKNNNIHQPWDKTHHHLGTWKGLYYFHLGPPHLQKWELELSSSMPGKVLGIIVGWDPSDSNSNWLHVDIFWFCFTNSRHIP